MELKVMVQTKSNYRDLNDKWLPVKEIEGKRVSCLISCPENGIITVDFTLSEVIKFKTEQTN